jgi:hypothetical protein
VHELVQRVFILKRDLADAVATAALAEMVLVSGSNALSPWSPVDEPMVNPKMYFVSGFWNPPLSCERAVIGFENSNAAITNKIANDRPANHPPHTRVDAFWLLEDVPRVSVRSDIIV